MTGYQQDWPNRLSRFFADLLKQVKEDATQPKVETSKRRASLPILPLTQVMSSAPTLHGIWRSPEEMARKEESRESPDREFPPQVDEPPDAVSRRHFLHLMGASFALAGLTAKAKNIDTAVLAPAPDGLVPPLEPWATKKADKGVDAFPPVPATEFTLVTAPFDPVAKPDTKRENPKVLSIGEYQVDLVRGPMKAFDVV